MTFRRPLHPWLLLLCVALLGARLGGAHLHLCLDGQEAPVSVHASEPGHDDAHHGDPAHSDRDVSLVSDALTPLSKLFIDLPTLLAVLCLALGAQALRPAAPPARRMACPSQARFYHPPLRGPPLLSH